jgi:hypothetical protein
MSATSGNVKVDILGAGTATIAAWLWKIAGQDAVVQTLGNFSGYWNTGSVTAANAVTASTAASCFVEGFGTFDVTGTGTLIPAQTMHDAAAAVLSVGSFFECWRIGATGFTSVGPWT